MSGNELIIQGGLEAGFSLYTGYPGSPLADFFNILNSKAEELKKQGIKVVIGNSEANAAAMASGAKQAGRDVLVAMKSMGLHVAADALSVGNFANPGPVEKDPKTGEEISPGVVIVVGDDPWSLSTSTPADSRYLYKHLHIPFLEPSTPQELKDWIKIALEISKRSSVYQGLLLTTFMAEGGGRVDTYPQKEVSSELVHLDPRTFNLTKNVMVPPNSLMADASMIKERFPKVKKILAEFSLDQSFGFLDSKIGFISSGTIFETLKQVLDEADYLDHVSLYKIACSYPLVDELLIPYLKGIDTLVVVEEKRGFLETELREFITRNNLNISIYGKSFKNSKIEDGFPANGGLNYEIIRDKITELLSILNLGPFKNDLNFDFKTWEKALPRRLPTFCPGCPHRETLSLLKDLRKTLNKEDIHLISHGDVGCYSLSFLQPFYEMHNLSAMGQGGALGAGVDFFTTNPSVVLMGDSTFFHSGITDISNSVQSGHSITYILLDNDNTAMTGHQMTPVSGVSVDAEKRPRQEILPIIRNLGVDSAIEVNPSDRYFYKNLLLETVRKEGVKVIVSNKECGLTFHGRKKREMRKKIGQGKTIERQNFYQINSSVCEDCRVCVEMTGCPGLSQSEDAYGTKVIIDPQICVSDSYCTKIKACPSFELVEVFDYHPTKYKGKSEQNFDENSIPLPESSNSFQKIAEGKDWRVVVTGVGGSGVTTISRVLAEAAKEMDGREDLDFKFMDQKGLAQRNGRVTGHLSIYKKGKSCGAITPMGTADLLLSPDLLDGSFSINFLSKIGKAFLDSQYQMPLSILLDYGEEAAPMESEKLKEDISKKLGDSLFMASMKDLSHGILGKSVYASAMILGVTFQAGRLPFSMENMREAFKNSIHKEEFDNNWKAFNLGRMCFLEGETSLKEKYVKKEAEINFHDLFKRSLKESFYPWQNSKPMINRYERCVNKLIKHFPEINEEYLLNYVHDIFVYDRGTHIEQFLIEAGEIAISMKDDEERKIALRTLAKTYWIKDEIFVSHIMVTPLQKLKNERMYKNLGSKFEVTHINRPSFDLLGRKIEFDIEPKDWMLKIMRHMRIFRFLMPNWHQKEKEISQNIRKEILGPILKLKEGQRRMKLAKLENIKGYRDIRYEKAQKAFS